MFVLCPLFCRLSFSTNLGEISKTVSCIRYFPNPSSSSTCTFVQKMITHKNFGCVAFWPQAHEFKHYWMRDPPWSSSLIWLLPSHPAASPSAAAGLCSPAVLAAHSGHCTCCATRVLACSRATIPLPEFARMSKCCPFVCLYNADGCKIGFAV